MWLSTSIPLHAFLEDGGIRLLRFLADLPDGEALDRRVASFFAALDVIMVEDTKEDTAPEEENNKDTYVRNIVRGNVPNQRGRFGHL